MMYTVGFVLIMLIATICDIRTRTIPDSIHIAIIVIAIITTNLNMWAMLILTLPFLIVAIISKGSFGGGDIKFIAVCSLYLGLYRGIGGLIVALLIALVVNKILKNKEFPLVPYLTIGYLMVL